MSETRPGGARIFRTELAGRPLIAEIGAVAKQANGAVLLRYGETVVLVTATASEKPREGIDFFPLRVDYEDRQYAVGRIPGSFPRREGRPSDRATLSARLMDRPIRPLFPDGFRNDVQVVAMPLSYDGENPPDITAMIGASIALSISDIPFAGPIGAVSVGLVDGELLANPLPEAQGRSRLEMAVAASDAALLMVEAGADEVPEDDIVAALEFGHAEIRRLCSWQREIIAAVGRPKVAFLPPPRDDALDAWMREHGEQRMAAAVLNPDKLARERDVANLMQSLREQALAAFTDPAAAAAVDGALEELERRVARRMILEQGVRPDGRKHDEIRPIWCDVGMLPRTHGSAIFTRGQTQVCSVATLGSISDRQMIDAVGERDDTKRYLHHYNFPPYSTGEVRPMRSPGRREIGHGALAERALVRMVPGENEFPYTIRVVSEVLESNGSTSMASVCGSTLSLMDAGVPLRRPVAGIAMGLVTLDGQSASGPHAILSDIQGMEDHLGDMDFKVAGTERGVTAIQMDIKIAGVDADLLSRALAQAKAGRMFILDHMLRVLPAPRHELSAFAPRITVLQIDPDRIRDVIGPGGKTINRIIAETGAEIDVEDDGRVFIAAPGGEAGRRAEEWVRRLTSDPQPGEVYVGKVVRLMNFGAFVEIVPGKDGLVHISELAKERVPSVEDVVEIGDQVIVKVKEIDELGRLNLSRRQALLTVPDAESREQIKPKTPRPEGAGDNGRPGPGRPGMRPPAPRPGSRTPSGAPVGPGPRPR